MKTSPLNSIPLDDLIQRSARALASIAPQLPTLAAAEEVLAQTAGAVERGYFLPDEDEQVRLLFANYLTTRAALLSVLDDLKPHVIAEVRKKTAQRPQVFSVAFCTACMLMRSGRFLIDSFRKQPVIWRKLDEAEPRFGIPPKQFTKIFRSVTSPKNIIVFREGIRYFENHEATLLRQTDPVVAPVIALLREELPFIQRSKSYYAQHRLRYRWHSFLRRNHSGFKHFTFGLFKLSGSLIAELRMKWKRKRVTPVVQRKIAKLLQPGDVIITRHDDAASNLFLPGFWPHGAFYIGTESQRRELDPSGVIWDQGLGGPPTCVLEARKDGVLLRPLDDTLKVDACVVLRPKLTGEQIRDAIARGMTHQGKSYDFEFDFRRTDKLVCTEVVYRAYHGIGDLRFELKSRAGRVCLSAEDLLDYAVAGRYFDVVLVYGADGNRFVTPPRAVEALRQSYRPAST